MPSAPARAFLWRLLGLWLAGLLAACLLAGPARAQDVATIAQARSALEAARSERTVRALAAAELDAAEQAFERALVALAADQEQSEIGHLAYLAERRAAIAQMRAKERVSARMLSSLTATHSLIRQARELEAAGAQEKVRALAERLRRFDVHADQRRLLLTPRERWFETGVMPARRAVPAIVEAAALLGRLPDRDVVVVGYAVAAGLQGAQIARDAVAPAPAGDGASEVVSRRLDDPAHDGSNDIGPGDLGCARADVVRAFLISNGVDPRRVVTACVALVDGPERPAGASSRPGPGETAIAILPEQGFAWTPAADLAIGGTSDRLADRAIGAGSGAP